MSDLDREYESPERWRYPSNEFVYEKLVTLKDTNMEGNVYFANYFFWQGEVRETMLLSHPNFSEEIKKYQQVKMITHSAHQHFFHESYLGDVVQIRMNTREIKRCSLVVVFKFFNKKTGLFLAEGWQKLAFADASSGKIQRIPPYILDLAIPIRIKEEAKETLGVDTKV